MSINTISILQQITINNPPTTNHHQQQQHKLLFQKSLTPSDVGKLNRLVIPKQYAEKYFPIRSPSGHHNKVSNHSLLSFEDEMSLKTWKFRYCYWTSSQSYVLTKGWSRYVKEKRLSAGDIVLFHRQRSNVTDKLFIGWRTTPNPSMNMSHMFRGRENLKMVSISSTPRRLRLFGVNMELAKSECDQSTSDDLI